MGSTGQEDRSLGGGISLPQWMKGKSDPRFDFGENALSPPSHDDSFFYIRYPRAENQQRATTQGYRPINEVISGNTISSSTTETTKPAKKLTDAKETRAVDFSKHPASCQPFIPSTANKSTEIKPPKVVIAGNVKPKSQGTDDGFHGEPALCGKSIVHVANQIMSSQFNKVFTNEPQESEHIKKGSKSLPASPLSTPSGSPDSSPKSRRKMIANRYFTGPFVPDREKYQGSWILASILGQSRDIATSKIDEEDERNLDILPARSLSRKKSISSQNLTYIADIEKKGPSTSTEKPKPFPNLLQAKPSELREMNFLSPTSM